MYRREVGGRSQGQRREAAEVARGRAAQVCTDCLIGTIGTDRRRGGTTPQTGLPRRLRGGEGGEAGSSTEPKSRVFKVKRYDFVVQFCWQPTTRDQRAALEKARVEAARAAQDAAADAAAADQPGEDASDADAPADTP